jgi:hypothetical protein
MFQGGKKGNGVTLKFAWQEKYTEAMLELNREQLPQRIDAAEKVICQRLEELKHAADASTEELSAISDALRGLRVLTKTECSPQGTSAVVMAQSGVAS